MESLRLHRWIDEPHTAVWQRLTDVDALLHDAADVDLLDRTGAGLAGGTVLRLERHHGRRASLLQVRIVEAQPPRRLTLSVAGRQARWVVHIALDPFGADCTEVTIHARCNRGGTTRRALPSPALQRLQQDLLHLLDALTRRVDRLTTLPG